MAKLALVILMVLLSVAPSSKAVKNTRYDAVKQPICKYTGLLVWHNGELWEQSFCNIHNELFEVVG